MLTIHFLMRLTHFKLLIKPVLPRFLLFCLNLSLYWTWKHIHHHRLGTKKRCLRFWYMGYCCLPDLGLLPRVDPFVLQWGKTHHMGHCLYPLLPYWLHSNFDSLSEPSRGPECCWYFSGYGVSVPVGSANSGHNIVALETNPCQVFGCLDYLHSDNGVPIITSTQQQGVWWIFHAPRHPWASGTAEHILLDNWLNNISNSASLSSYWSTHLSKTICSLNITLFQGGSFPLICFLGNY